MLKLAVPDSSSAVYPDSATVALGFATDRSYLVAIRNNCLGRKVSLCGSPKPVTLVADVLADHTSVANCWAYINPGATSQATR